MYCCNIQLFIITIYVHIFILNGPTYSATTLFCKYNIKYLIKIGLKYVYIIINK